METSSETPNELIPSGFVLNPIKIDACLPFKIADDCTISKASNAQILEVKKSLEKIFPVTAFTTGYPVHFFYEYEIDLVINGRYFISTDKPLLESDWRYYIVTATKRQTNEELHLASQISKAPLNLNALSFWANLGWVGSYHPQRLHKYYRENDSHPVTMLDQQSLDDLSEIYKLWKKVIVEPGESTKFPEIRRALEMYENLNELPSGSQFHILGLFAIIEMLVTHNPKLEDRGDSITHQMKSKMPLLARRFDLPVDAALFFSDVSSDKIWSALYSLRSTVAHGGRPDFSSSQLRVLKDEDNAKSFLRFFVKSLIRHALHEPDLYKDLRAC